MRASLFRCVFLLFLLSVCAVAQGRPSGGRSAGNSSNATAPGSGPPSISPTIAAPTVFISGKVALDDGTELTDPAAIETICRGRRHTVAYTDRRGSFSFQFGDPNTPSADFSDASNSMMTRNTGLQQQRNWQDCELQVVLAGFSSDVIEFTSRMSALESADFGRLVLHRLAHVEGTSISVTTVAAPKAARKALDKAREDEQKGKWNPAQQLLQKAVGIYPRYAVAWFELGRIQLREADTAAAKESFEHAVAADPKYVNPYDGLAQLAFQANEWPQVVEITNKLLALNPVNFPGAYFLNGVANFYLHDLAAAENSTRAGIKIDEGHQVPKLQYLLGMILLQKHDYQQATDYLQQYLHMAKEPVEVEEAKKTLAEAGRLSATPNAAAIGDKK